MTSFTKQKLALRYWLLGKGYHKALEAMELAATYHKKTRKDGAHEFSHQVAIAHYVRTLLPLLQCPEETLCVVFLHDIPEDYGLSYEELLAQFGKLVADAVWAMTKTFRGVKRDEQALFDEMAANIIASIAKGADRIHNLQTMHGAFTIEKQKAYIEEVFALFFPMLKRARRNFPSQEQAYENIKHMLESQIALVQAMHQAIEA